MNPHEFVTKWSGIDVSERAMVQSHFNDLCAMLGVPAPLDEDPTGSHYAFEKHVTKVAGGKGFADVWRRGAFAWEYKGKHANLDKAYQQLLQYREALENPPLLMVSDVNTIEIHTNFTNTPKKITTIALTQLLETPIRDLLRRVWTEPESFRARQTTAQVTEAAARSFAKLADILRERGYDAHTAAQFLIRLLFCLFAEDIGLLPNQIFSKLVAGNRSNPDVFVRDCKVLFTEMAQGGFFYGEPIRHFNGDLFADDTVLRIPREGLNVLHEVSALDWSSIEPAIFGTLFERSLDPRKRAQLGAHYTGREDILLIVEPVLMAPLRREWAEVQTAARAEAAQGGKGRAAALARLTAFMEKLATLRVLDPAAGSGNFLYVALKQLLDLEKEVYLLHGEIAGQYDAYLLRVAPEQLHGIEVNEFAHELAQATIWIGYIQWKRDNGFGSPADPILKNIQLIDNRDAILTFDDEGNPVEPEWPEADVIIGNPPFLGGNKIRKELGDTYVDALFKLYGERVPASADLVTYWFERARAYIEKGNVKRVGLLSTNSIRGGANRTVLQRIKKTGDIFMAWSDREWVLDGAAVRVSMIGFDEGSENVRTLDAKPVNAINPDLTASVNITVAQPLRENAGICFRTDEKGGSFDIDNQTAQRMLKAIGNPNGRPNSDVILPWVNGLDITRRPRNMWIIDFGVDTPLEDAVLYEMPFAYVEQHVKPERANNNIPRLREKWWIHRIPGADMRKALNALPRFIVTPAVAKYRLFVWLSNPTLPDHQLYAFARDDDYFFGVLHSRVHELWALRMGTSLEDRPRYTPTTTFETFPFPFPPGQEAQDDPRVQAIAAAAADLNAKRERALNPAGADPATLKKLTLTNLYNQRPHWLALAHERLDRAVFAAYGWEWGLSDDEILEKLLRLNQDRQ